MDSQQPPYSGILIVQTTSAREAIPIEDATVVVRLVTDEENSKILTVMHTDKNGLTAPLSIETPSPAESLAPSGAKPFTEIALEISADGYYSIIDTHVPIYPGITSVQPARMIPVPDVGGVRYPSDRVIVNDERGTPTL